MSVGRLRELLTVAESDELGELGEWLEPRLRDYLMRASEGVTLDQCLGLAVGPGKAPWHTKEAMAARDNAILALAEFLPDQSPSAQAEQIATWSRRYVASAWRHDRDKPEMPGHYRGTRKEPLYKALKAFSRFPKVSRIRDILLGS